MRKCELERQQEEARLNRNCRIKQNRAYRDAVEVAGKVLSNDKLRQLGILPPPAINPRPPVVRKSNWQARYWLKRSQRSK